MYMEALPKRVYLVLRQSYMGKTNAPNTFGKSFTYNGNFSCFTVVLSMCCRCSRDVALAATCFDATVLLGSHYNTSIVPVVHVKYSHLNV
jgi:hypothetical protein